MNDSLNDLNKMLNVVFLVNEEDSLIWKFNSIGLFSVNSLYGNTFDDCINLAGLRLGLWHDP